MSLIAGEPIFLTNDMAPLLDHARALLVADPRLSAISIRALTSRYSHAGPTPEYDDTEDARGLHPVDVIYHLSESPGHELYEPAGSAAMAAAFVVERRRGLFARTLYEEHPALFGGRAFISLIGVRTAGVFPCLSSLHAMPISAEQPLRYFPIFHASTSQHQRLAASREFCALARHIAERS